MKLRATVSWAIVFCLLAIWLAIGRGAFADSIVAADGSGQYRSIQEAIMATPPSVDAQHPWVIHIKPGTYHEILYAQREKRFIALRGEDPENTIITYGLSASLKGLDGKPIGTFRTPTVTVDADDFTIENLTLTNSAGAVGQALALRVDGDRCIFRHCRFIGWQDTIFANRGRQLFDRCTIAGCTDFIFGGATSFFDRCDIHILGNGYIAAAATPDFQKYGMVFSNCRIVGDRPGLSTYLGRAWRAHAFTAWLNTEMSAVVNPAGWHHWNEKDGSSRYYEYHSTGGGADVTQRVSWAQQLSDAQAAEYSVENVLAGSDGWKPAVGPSPTTAPAMPATLPFDAPTTIKVKSEAATSQALVPALDQPPIPPLTASMNLWPGDVPRAKPATQPERDDGTGRMWNVSVPGVLAYLPTQSPPEGGRTAIIVCPGGGYTHLTRLVGADGAAGTFVPQGIAVIALKYRLKPASGDVEADTLADGRRAVRLVRAHATEWGINPHKVGLLGWSAGANLALNLATHPDADGAPSDDVDRQTDRPDFVALLSPWPDGRDAQAYPVSAATPPAFICTALDDKTAPPVFAMKVAAQYAEAHAPFDIHVVPSGGHAAYTIGGSSDGSHWPEWFVAWLRGRGLLD
jgi:pectinesterase